MGSLVAKGCCRAVWRGGCHGSDATAPGALTAPGNRSWNRTYTSAGGLGKLKRFDHHLAHTANAYYASSYDRALIVTLDGYGSGLAGSVSVGEGGRIRRLHTLDYPHSLGTFTRA